jgi:hypothetical protein
MSSKSMIGGVSIVFFVSATIGLAIVIRGVRTAVSTDTC